MESNNITWVVWVVTNGNGGLLKATDLSHMPRIGNILQTVQDLEVIIIQTIVAGRIQPYRNGPLLTSLIDLLLLQPS